MAAAALPTKMKALFLVKFMDTKSDNLDEVFEVREVDVPTPRSGEVLVHVAYSPINPSDMSTLSGTYNAAQRQPLPARVGYEASGVVVASGGGVTTWGMVGKRVGIVTTRGGQMWAEFVCTPAVQCIALPPSLPLEVGCSCFVNPLSVVAMVDIAKSRRISCIVHTPGASALGKMLIQYAPANNVQVIALVRRDEQEETLRGLGAKHIVNTSKDGWEEELKNLATSMQARLGFDAVAGDQTGKVLAAMPPNSELQVYGGMSMKSCSGLNPQDVIFRGKRLGGFWLTSYLKTCNMLTKKRMLNTVGANVSGCLGTDVRAKFPLEKGADAVRDSKANASGGKAVFEIAGEDAGKLQAPAPAPAPAQEEPAGEEKKEGEEGEEKKGAEEGEEKKEAEEKKEEAGGDDKPKEGEQ